MARMETSNGTHETEGRPTLRRSFFRRSRLAAGGTLTAILLASLLAPTTAHAQSDVAPALPNVLILLDTSGSMERMPNSSIPPVAVGTTSTTVKNRWIQALEVLGGGISNYKMVAIDRNSTDFKTEYSLGGTNPYDSGYYLN